MPSTKVVGRRFLAALIDVIPGFVVYWGLIRTLGDHLGRESGTQLVMQTEIINGDVRAQFGGDVYRLESGTFLLVAALAMAYWIGVYVIWQGRTGATIGKTVLGIRTVGEDGQPCGIGRAAARWALLVVDLFPFCLPLVGLISALASDGNRRVGDMVAKTYVIRAGDVGQPVRTPRSTMQASMPNPPGTGAPGAGVPASPLPEQGASAPQWDERRNAYVQWDPAQQAWLQWDDRAEQWGPADR